MGGGQAAARPYRIMVGHRCRDAGGVGIHLRMGNRGREDFSWGKAAALPYRIVVGHRCRDAGEAWESIYAW